MSDCLFQSKNDIKLPPCLKTTNYTKFSGPCPQLPLDKDFTASMNQGVKTGGHKVYPRTYIMLDKDRGYTELFNLLSKQISNGKAINKRVKKRSYGVVIGSYRGKEFLYYYNTNILTPLLLINKKDMKTWHSNFKNSLFYSPNSKLNSSLKKILSGFKTRNNKKYTPKRRTKQKNNEDDEDYEDNNNNDESQDGGKKVSDNAYQSENAFFMRFDTLLHKGGFSYKNSIKNVYTNESFKNSLSLDVDNSFLKNGGDNIVPLLGGKLIGKSKDKESKLNTLLYGFDTKKQRDSFLNLLQGGDGYTFNLKASKIQGSSEVQKYDTCLHKGGQGYKLNIDSDKMMGKSTIGEYDSCQLETDRGQFYPEAVAKQLQSDYVKYGLKKGGKANIGPVLNLENAKIEGQAEVIKKQPCSSVNSGLYTKQVFDQMGGDRYEFCLSCEKINGQPVRIKQNSCSQSANRGQNYPETQKGGKTSNLKSDYYFHFKGGANKKNSFIAVNQNGGDAYKFELDDKINGLPVVKKMESCTYQKFLKPLLSE